MDPISIAVKFVETINAADPEALAELLSEDHLFTDALDQSWRGREVVVEAWRDYLVLFPNYHITIERTFADGAVVVLLGRARGTYAPDGELSDENRWDIPAAWKGVIGGEHVNEWRVYADNGPVREIVERGKIAS